MPSQQSDLKALRNLLEQARKIVSSDPIPPGGRKRAAELLDAAVSLSNALVRSKQPLDAAILGKRGGEKTAQRGPEYFAKIAAMRKTRGGGRPRKSE